MKWVGYVRVSTARQGRSGLGLEAQQNAIQQHVVGRGGSLVQTFKEVESGRDNSRPQLAKALELARLTGTTLVIAKLDRLSRNATFLLALQESGVRFVATDMPDANELTVGIMALVAQQERRAISQRTREAPQAARARGTKLGNPNGAAALRRAVKGNEAALKATREIASARAEALRGSVEELRGAGKGSLGEIAAELNARGILTARNARGTDPPSRTFSSACNWAELYPTGTAATELSSIPPRKFLPNILEALPSPVWRFQAADACTAGARSNRGDEV